MAERSEYWANGTPDECISRCKEHISHWGGNDAPSSDMFTSIASAWRRNITAYYSCMVKAQDWTTSLGYVGSQGELVDMTVPVSRTLLRQFVSIATKQRLNFEIDANTFDSKAMQISRVGKVLANHYVNNDDLDSKLFRASEQCGVWGAGYLTCMWRTDKGYMVSADIQNGVPIMSGENHFETPSIAEVIYDWTSKYNEGDWVLLKLKRNRYNMAAQFPEAKDQIYAASSIFDARKELFDLAFVPSYVSTDQIYECHFIHRITNAMPEGRHLVFLEAGGVLNDGPNIYGKDLPCVQIMFEEMLDTGLGYPMLSSLLPAQEMFDHSLSVQATNQSAFGVQSLLVPKGADIAAAQIEGLNFITYKPQSIEGGGKPEPLQLTKSPAEILPFQDRLERLMESTSYLNAAIRGNPPPGVTAGTAIATLSANAQEFLTSASKSIVTAIERVVYLAIQNDQRFGTEEHLRMIVGPTNAYMLKSLKDEGAFKRVKAKTSNPLLASTTGRLQLSEMLLNAQMIKNPQDLFSVIEGAPSEAMYSTEYDENIAVRSEVDALLAGEEVTPLITDNHPLFIRALSALLYEAKERREGDLVGRVTEVIQERVRLEMECPPEMKAMLRGLPMPPPQQQVAPGQIDASAVQGMEPQTASSSTATPAEAPASI